VKVVVFSVFWRWAYLMKVVVFSVFWRWAYLMKVVVFSVFWRWTYLMKVVVFSVFWRWTYLMKVVVFSVFWRWAYLMKVVVFSVFWRWAYLVKVVPETWYLISISESYVIVVVKLKTMAAKIGWNSTWIHDIIKIAVPKGRTMLFFYYHWIYVYFSLEDENEHSGLFSDLVVLVKYMYVK
jgi:hypothetical protein